VVRLALENSSWGYDRIIGAMANLGDVISAQSVGNILRRHGIPSAPDRKKNPTYLQKMPCVT
jgi:putative transposase